MSVLDDILVDVRADLAERQARVSLDDLKARAEGRPDCRKSPLLRGEGVAVIAEVKRSSPSKGALAAIADPAALAADYEAGGAAIIAKSSDERSAQRPQMVAARTMPTTVRTLSPTAAPTSPWVSACTARSDPHPGQ